MPKPLPPAEMYEAIRRDNPGEDIGDHWEGVGAMLGDGVWADPDAFGLPGEYGFAYPSLAARARGGTGGRKAQRRGV